MRKVSPKINDLIKEELNLQPDYDFQFFIPKPLQRITLYYIYDIHEKDKSLVLSKLLTIGFKDKKLSNVFATSTVKFFGNYKDELVVLVGDFDEELRLLNQDIKSVMHKLNEEYEIKDGAELYDVTKSEKFSYLPHLGLGRIRTQSIKNNIKDPSQVEAVFDRIRMRIMELLTNMLKDEKSLKLPIITYGILQFPDRNYVKWFGPEPVRIKY